MKHEDLERTAQLFAGVSLKDELITLANRATNRIQVALLQGDVEGHLYYEAREQLIRMLIEKLENHYEKGA